MTWSSSSAPAGWSTSSRTRSSGMSPGETKDVEHELADGSTARLDGHAQRDQGEGAAACRRRPRARRERVRHAGRAARRHRGAPAGSDRRGDRIRLPGRRRRRARRGVRRPAVGPARRRARERAARRASCARSRAAVSPRRPTSPSSNQTPEQLRDQLRAEAALSVARELVLDAVADQLGIEVSDEEIEAVLREQGETDETVAEVMARRSASRSARICACARRSTASPPR